MLPLPGTPSCSWARFRQRFGAIFSGADPRVCVAFWLFGKTDCALNATDQPISLVCGR